MNRVTATDAGPLSFNQIMWLANAYRVGEYHLAIEEKTMRTVTRPTIPADQAEEMRRLGLCLIVESGMGWRRRIVRTERGQDWLQRACDAIFAELGPDEKKHARQLWFVHADGKGDTSELVTSSLLVRAPRLAERAGDGARLTDLGRAVMRTHAGL